MDAISKHPDSRKKLIPGHLISMSWKINPANFSTLRKMPGVVGCLVETEPLRLKETRRRWSKAAG